MCRPSCIDAQNPGLIIMSFIITVFFDHSITFKPCKTLIEIIFPLNNVTEHPRNPPYLTVCFMYNHIEHIVSAV